MIFKIKMSLETSKQLISNTKQHSNETMKTNTTNAATKPAKGHPALSRPLPPVRSQASPAPSSLSAAEATKQSRQFESSAGCPTLCFRMFQGEKTWVCHSQSMKLIGWTLSVSQHWLSKRHGQVWFVLVCPGGT